MTTENAAVKRGRKTAGIAAALLVMLFAAVLALGYSAAWAEEEGDAFAEVNDVEATGDDSADPDKSQESSSSNAEGISEDTSETNNASASEGDDAGKQNANQEDTAKNEGEGEAAKLADESENSASELVDNTTASGRDADSSIQYQPQLPGEFAKHEVTVEQGKVFLVGFASKASDAKSDDENLVAWRKDWQAYVKENGVDVSAKSGWLLAEDEQGDAIDYDQVTGIVCDQPDVFELLGEYPEYKVDEQGIEYRWWYGLLGKAKKAGDAKVWIVYHQEDGTNLVADECLVHVVEPEADERASIALATQSQETNQSPEGEAASASDEAAATSPSAAASNAASGGEGAAVNVSTAAADDSSNNESTEGTGAAGDDGTTSSDASSGNAATSSGLSSKSATDGGTGLSSSAAGSTSGNAADGATTNRGAVSAYPKEVAVTAQGSKITGTLLVNDAAAEEAYLRLANNVQLSLAVEEQTAYTQQAETTLASLARTAGTDTSERLSVKVVNGEGAEVAISGMNVTVKLALDDTTKLLDPTSVQVWYLGEDGSSEKKDAQIENGFLSFATDHLSNYAVLGKKSSSTAAAGTTGTSSTGTTSSLGSTSTSTGGKSGLPQTGDPIGYLAVALAFVAGFSASSALNARRRMKEMPFGVGIHAKK